MIWSLWVQKRSLDRRTPNRLPQRAVRRLVLERRDGVDEGLEVLPW